MCSFDLTASNTQTMSYCLGELYSIRSSSSRCRAPAKSPRFWCFFNRGQYPITLYPSISMSGVAKEKFLLMEATDASAAAALKTARSADVSFDLRKLVRTLGLVADPDCDFW
mmetsp:Transcript_46656/g.77168  ORF Transcript_46656/g.77168 Transcript_46656/m.77168 type:complete len:112 (-) Transcript_46656:275-610(-)